MRHIETRLLGRDVSFTVSEPWLAYWLVILGLLVWMVYAVYKVAATTPGGATTE